jgi:hypothetical protein
MKRPGAEAEVKEGAFLIWFFADVGRLARSRETGRISSEVMRGPVADGST